VIPDWLPVILLVTASLAVSDWLPEVLNVAENAWLPESALVNV